MRKTKQLLSCLLVLLMIFSLAPQVFAYEDWNIPGNNYPAGQSLYPSGQTAYPDRDPNYFPNQQPDEYYEWSDNFNQWQRAGGHYHQYTGYTVLRPATCSSYGEAYMYCAICGEPKTEIIQKLPHTWGEWEILLEATDHSAGLRQHTCLVCGTVEQENFDPEGTLRPGAHGDAVEELQHLLVENGILDRHMIDRDFGWFTEQAVKEAEKAAGMEQDGIAWPMVINHLRHDFGAWKYTAFPLYETAGHKERTCSKCGYVEKVDIGKKLERGAYGDDVRRLQERLTELGFKIGTADGSFGRRTQQAIEVIQGIYELPRDGIVWPGIWQMLFPDDDLRFERENDGPVRIDGVYLPNWDRVISDSGSETDHKDGKLITEKEAALDVSIRITNAPAVFDYYYRDECLNYEITVTNIGELTFSNVTLELKNEPSYWEGEEVIYTYQTIENFTPGETRTYTPTQTGVYYMFEGQETASTTVIATGTGLFIDEPVVVSDTVVHPVGPNPAHATIRFDSVEFPDNGGNFTEGDEIVFQATITNDGPIPLTHAVIKGEFSYGIGVYQVADIYDTLEPGASMTDTYTYKVTQECMDFLAKINEVFPTANMDFFDTFAVFGEFYFNYNGADLTYRSHDNIAVPKEDS